MAEPQTGKRTLPDHDRCDTHRGYKLSCEQYERLLTRSGQRCEIKVCRADVRATSQRKLSIDHSGPWWAVRGLLCTRCNTQLKDGRGWFEGGPEYLANTWWIQECKRVGMPTQLPPEPAIGAAIRDQHGIAWIHETDGLWHAHGRTRPGASRLTWERIYGMRGPHNMAPFDVYGPGGSQLLQWQVERALQAGAAEEREAAAYERGRHDVATSVLAELTEGDQERYLEWADDGGWGDANGEPQSDTDRLVQAASSAMNDIYTDLHWLTNRIVQNLEEMPGGVGYMALRDARHRMYEHMGPRFGRDQFAGEAVFQLGWALGFSDAHKYLESLPPGEHVAWLEYISNAFPRPMGLAEATVRAARVGQEGTEGLVLEGMCHGDGDIISRCLSRASYSCKFESCCNGKDDPHEHSLCDSHLAQAADGTLCDKDGRPRVLVDFSVHPEPESAGVPF